MDLSLVSGKYFGAIICGMGVPPMVNNGKIRARPAAEAFRRSVCPCHDMNERQIIFQRGQEVMEINWQLIG